MIIVGSYGGANLDPSWVRNLRANPRVRVELPEESYDVLAEELPRGERDLPLSQDR